MEGEFLNSRDSRTTLQSTRLSCTGELNCEDVIFEGKVASEKRVNLLYDDVTRHYHVIANLTGAMSKQYICAVCSKSCDSGVTHKFSEACSDCMSIPPCISTHVRIPCGSCNRTFRSQACFERHKTNKLKGKPVCMQRGTAQNVTV